MCLPWPIEFKAFCSRALSRLRCSLNALDNGSRCLPWIGCFGSIGGRLTSFAACFNTVPTLFESRIFRKRAIVAGKYVQHRAGNDWAGQARSIAFDEVVVAGKLDGK